MQHIMTTIRSLLLLGLAVLLTSAALAAPEGAKQGKLFIRANVDALTIRVLNLNVDFNQGMSLPAGGHILQISKEGFETQTKKVKVDEGKDTVLHIVMEKSAAGAPAAVAPGQTPGQTPATGALASQPAAQPGGPLVEQAPMGNRQGKERLYVKPIPADALVRIINIQERFHSGIELGQGHYVLQIKKEGYETEVKEIDMVRGNDMTVTIPLRPKGAPKPDAPAAADPAAAPQATGPETPAAPTATAPQPPPIGQPAATAPTTPTGPTGPTTITSDVTAVPADPDTVIAVGKPSGDGKTRITVRPEPTDATVRVLNFRPKYQAGMEIKPNKYEIEVSRKGYEPKKVKVDVRAREDNVFDVALVSLTPPTQAPKPESGAEAQPTQPAPPAQAIPPTGSPEDNYGRLYVRCDVPDAAIRVLNADKPFVQGLKLPEGLYIVEVRKKGYETRILKVALHPGMGATIEATMVKAAPQAAHSEEPKTAPTETPIEQPEGAGVPSEPEPTKPAPPPVTKAKVYIQTTPASAAIHVVETNEPFEQGMELEQGAYTIEIKKDGYETAKETLRVEPGREARLEVALKALAPAPAPVAQPTTPQAPAETPVETPAEPKKGKLFVKTDATDASVKLLGVKPKFEQGLELEPGKYKIEVSRPGQPAKSLTAELIAGKDTLLEVKFGESGAVKPEDQNRADQAAPLIEQAAEAERAKNYQGALDLLGQALNTDKNSARAYKKRGDVLRALKQPAEALDSYNKAIELAPNFDNAYIDRGNLYTEMNDPESACYDYWKACALGRCREVGLSKQKGLCK